ncbi:MAG: hypothetical protein LBL86_08700 [Coriobacteriales bacterium]|nr:hypothetical protein [Coriobacteriales bacterium]
MTKRVTKTYRPPGTAPIRRATGADQLEALRWLCRKFPAQAGEIVGEQG